MKKVIIFVLLICVSFTSFGFDYSSAFDRANKLYMGKQYEKSLEEYKKIEKRLNEKGEKSFKLYYNLGCVYYRLKDYPNARLYFEKAKRIKPLDKSLLKNLELVKIAVKDKTKSKKEGFFVDLFRKIYLSAGLNLFTVITALFFIACFVFIALIISARFDRKKLYYGLGVSVFLFFVFFSLFYSRYKFTFSKEAVVFSDSVDVFSEPNTSSTVLFKLNSGMKVSVEENLNGYAHISLPDGLNGWVDRQYLKEIE